ncbi:MAG: aldehyde dehydrogenase family protein [Lachnospiraceae bacterium]|nr:aldehyde dehydrogenase family protein [Lachnospiraceae bacterium]
MNLEAIVSSQREYFLSGATKDIQFRKNSLERLLESVKENEPAIYTGLRQDLNKSEYEVYMTEMGNVIHSIKNAIRHIDSWSRPRKVKTPAFLFPAKSMHFRAPYGVALVMSPWNYPFLLSLMPLVAAIAAGNCVILKTSKNSPATSGVIVDMINSTFDRNYVYAIEEVLPYDEILRQNYDYIFFTGSERVGKTVMRAASEHLTPVTLELGGKNPCIVDETANVDMAAKKIMWGKLLSAGQTCIAPDYVLAHESIKDQLVTALASYARQFTGDPFINNDYPRIVNLHHYMRLKNLISRESGVIGGRFDDNQMRIEPAIFPNATFDSPVMKDEIFGPILPVIAYDDRDYMLNTLLRRPKPLSVYVFSRNRSLIRKVREDIDSGCCCINDCIIHLSNEELPFGGVGTSGMGRYHGIFGYETFTYDKSVYSTGSNSDVSLRYPPFDKHKLSRLHRTVN